MNKQIGGGPPTGLPPASRALLVTDQFAIDDNGNITKKITGQELFDYFSTVLVNLTTVQSVGGAKTFTDTTTVSTLTDGALTINSGAITDTDYIIFNLTATPTHVEGQLHWAEDAGTLSVDLAGAEGEIHVGQEMVLGHRPKNTSGSIIN